MSKTNVLGVGIDRVSMTQAMELLEEFVASKKPHQVVTVNPEFLVEAQSNKQFAECLDKADLAVGDGIGVVFASQLIGKGLPERIAGVDLLEDLAIASTEQGWSWYLVGAGTGVAEKAGVALMNKFEGLKIVGAEEGLEPGDFDNKVEIDALVDRVAKAKPSVLLVAFGAPKQDLFISENKSKLGVPVMIGVGGSFDFWAGKVRRAPRIWQSFGLEWLWRLVQEPKRVVRIWKAVIIFPLLVIKNLVTG